MSFFNTFLGAFTAVILAETLRVLFERYYKKKLHTLLKVAENKVINRKLNKKVFP